MSRFKPDASKLDKSKNAAVTITSRYRFITFSFAGFLFALACLLYLPVSDFDFLKLDDDGYVTQNLNVQRGISSTSAVEALCKTVAGNWHPVTILSHMLDCSLFGLNAGLHHLVNVGLHVLNLILLVGLVCVWTGKYLPAILVGALFALHPLRVESVAWISERKDVLSSAFWLVGLGIYSSWVKRRHWAKFVLLALSLTLGLLSKAMLVTFPFTLLLLDIWPLRRIELSRRFLVDREFWRGLWPLFREKLPLFAITATFCWVALYAQRSADAIADLEILPFTVRIQTAMVAYVSYLDKFFRPLNLACMYPHPGSWPWGLVLGSGLILILITPYRD